MTDKISDKEVIEKFNKLWQEEMEKINTIKNYPPNFSYMFLMTLRITLKLLNAQKDEFTKTLNSGRKMYLLGKKEARQELIDMVEGKIKFQEKIINNGQYTLYDWRIAKDTKKELSDILTKLKQK